MDDKKGTRTMGSPSRGDTPRDAAKLVGETVGKYRIARVLGEGAWARSIWVSAPR